MTISAYGFDGSMGEGTLAIWDEARQVGGYFHGVSSGGAIGNGSGTRTSKISGPFTIYAPGVVAVGGSDVTVTHDAQSSGTRVDCVACEFNWGDSTSALGTPANGAQIVIVKGSSGSTPPALTQVKGNIWQVPLRLVTVRATTTGAIPTADATTVKPIPRKVYPLTGSLRATDKTLAGDADPFTICTIAVPDPGWPYYLRFYGSAAFTCSTTGTPRASLITQVDGSTVSGGRSNSDNFDVAGTRRTVTLATMSLTSYVGPHTVTLQIAAPATGASQSITYQGDGLDNFFLVEQVPA